LLHDQGVGAVVEDPPPWLSGAGFDADPVRPADKNVWQQVNDSRGEPGLPDDVRRLQMLREAASTGPQHRDDRNDERF
jgi:hypothetical protein